MKFGKQDKGVAGLTILLSIVTTLFVMGLLVMIFSLMGGEMQDATYTSTTTSVVNESGAYVNATGYTLANYGAFNGVYSIDAVYNATDGVLVDTNRYALASGVLTNATTLNWADANVSYSYTYDATNGATNVMNDTTTSIATVTDWFPIFIVIGAMVVLILLTVIIITAIRGSGLMEASA